MSRTNTIVNGGVRARNLVFIKARSLRSLTFLQTGHLSSGDARQTAPPSRKHFSGSQDQTVQGEGVVVVHTEH